MSLVHPFRLTVLTCLLPLLLLLVSGCGGGGNVGIEGAWRGNLVWASEAGTQSMFWSVFQNPASPGRPDAVRWTLRLETAEGCVIDLDYGLLAPADDGTVPFPAKRLNSAACYPEVSAEQLAAGNRLELLIEGAFTDDPDAANGTATLRVVNSSGSVVDTVRTGTWECTLDQ